MAFRFEKRTQVEAAVFYALVQHGPAIAPLTQPTVISASTSFEDKVKLTFASIMRQDIDTLMSTLQTATDANVVPFSLTANREGIRKQLLAAQQQYNQVNPQPVSPPALTMKLGIAGLEGDQVAAVQSLFNASDQTPQEFWKTLGQNPALQSETVALLQSVFSLSQLTGEQPVLTDQLIQAQNIKTPADLAKLAGNTSLDWLAILKRNKIQAPAGTPGGTSADQLDNFAAELERNFTAAFPTGGRVRSEAVAERSGQQRRVGFGQIHHRIRPTAAPNAAFATPEFTNQLKKTQRVFKLSPSYNRSNTLLADNIDSAHKIYRMGQSNFVAKYGPSIGEAEAIRVPEGHLGPRAGACSDGQPEVALRGLPSQCLSRLHHDHYQRHERGGARSPRALAHEFSPVRRAFVRHGQIHPGGSVLAGNGQHRLVLRRKLVLPDGFQKALANHRAVNVIAYARTQQPALVSEPRAETQYDNRRDCQQCPQRFRLSFPPETGAHALVQARGLGHCSSRCPQPGAQLAPRCRFLRARAAVLKMPSHLQIGLDEQFTVDIGVQLGPRIPAGPLIECQWRHKRSPCGAPFRIPYDRATPERRWRSMALPGSDAT